MVAVFTGNGLGLFNASLTPLGNAGIGQSRDRQYVNLATGNLVLQSLDERLVARGLDAGHLRTYNSRGTVAGAGQDGWLTGYERSVRLVGALADSTSRVELDAGDGQVRMFAWIATNAYRSTDGDGAHDLIVWNSFNSTWQLTEGSTRRDEIYANHADPVLQGRLTAFRDYKSDGTTPARFDVVYDAQNRVSQVRAVDGVVAVDQRDALVFAYDGSGRVTSISTREGGVLKSQVGYGYDAVGRLQWVQTDLTPTIATDNDWNAGPNDGLRFRTTYTYASKTASDLRISRVEGSDGVRVEYGYQADGAGGWRVTTVTQGSPGDGSQRTTNIAYNGSTTHVTDSGGRTTSYTYDAQGRLLEQLDPAVDGLRRKVSYTWDANGNLLRAAEAAVVDGSGNQNTLLDSIFEYDWNGNRVLQRDRLGNTVKWTYSVDNQMLSETRYTGLDPDGLDPGNVGVGGLPVGAETTRYVYDSRMRLRFVVGAQGEVREYTYATSGNGIGQVASERRYVGHAYTGTGFTEGNLASWATSARKAASMLTEHAYDAKGRLQRAVQYATVNTLGSGVFDAAAVLTHYTHDAQGLLRQQIQVHGPGRTATGTAPIASHVSDYVYDGLGRLVASLTRTGAVTAMPDPLTDPAGHAAWLANNDANTLLTTWSYQDSLNSVRIVHDAGVVRVEARNAAGELVSVTDAGPTTPGLPGIGLPGPSPSGGYEEIQPIYPPQEPVFSASAASFESAGAEPTAAAAATGVAVRTQRNYYDQAGLLRASEDAAGGRSYHFYDAAGRRSATVDATGAVTEYRYDAAGRLLRTVEYATALDTRRWLSGTTVTKNRLVYATTPPPLGVGVVWVPIDAANDRHAQRTYDDAGRLATTTDAAGLVSTHVYDGKSRIVSTTQTRPGDGNTVPRTVRHFYDAGDRVVATLDAAGYLTEAVYDAGGRLAKTIRYANETVGDRDTGTLEQLRPATHENDQITRHFRDGLGREIGTLDAEGYLTESVFDEANNDRATRRYGKQLIKLTGIETLAALCTQATTDVPAGTIAVRETRRTFDAMGRPLAEIDHEGTYTRWYYDEAGRLLKTQRGNVAAEIREGNRRYDVFGNLIGELGGEGSLHLSAGMTEEQIDGVYAAYGIRHAYDALNRRIESIDAGGNKTWYFHDAQGRQTFLVRGVESGKGVANADGEVSEARYNAFGDATETIAYSGRISLAVPGDRARVQSAIAVLGFDPLVDSRTRYRYDRRGLQSEVTDARGFRTTQTWTAFGQAHRQETFEADATTLFASLTRVYDSRGLLTTQIQSGGGLMRAQSWMHDAFGRAVWVIPTRGSWTTVGYDRLGRQVSQTRTVGGRDESAEVAYDAFGQVISERNALGQETTYRYDDAARSVTVTTPEGVAVTSYHDRFGQRVRVTQALPDGTTATTETTFDKDGHVVGVTDALGNLVDHDFDARGLLIRTTDASGRIVDFVHDAAGRVIRRIEDIDGLALETSYEFDGQGRQILVTDASGRVVRMSYDPAGNLEETLRDPGGLALKTTYAWDRDGRQLNVVAGADTAAAQTTTYDYDKFGRRIRETQGAGSTNLVTAYAYDDADNVVSRTDGSGREIRYSYDGANRLRFALDGAGNVSEFAYDLGGRQTMRRSYAAPLDPSLFVGVQTEQQMAAAVDSLADDLRDDIEYQIHDDDGRLVATVDGAGGVATWHYDSAGRRTGQHRYATPIALTDTLRAELRAGATLAAIADVDASASDQGLRALFDAAGRVVATIDAAGGVVRTFFDAAGRVATQVRLAYRLDNPGLIGDATTLAQLDAMLGWSNADQAECFVRDAAGRLRYTINSLGQLTEHGLDEAGRSILTRTFAAAMPIGEALLAKLLAGTAGEADFAAFVAANAADARVQYTAYDRAGRARFTVTRSDGVGLVNETRYDAADRVVAHAQYGTPIAFDPARTAAEISVAVAGQTPRTTHYVHDAAGRLRFTIDATGAAAETRYDGAGRVTDTLTFGERPPTGTRDIADLFLWALTRPAAQVRRTRFDYDSAGRMWRHTDAAGKAETSVFDAVGRRISRTDRNGHVWTYEYDAAGRCTDEISPPTLVSRVDENGELFQQSRAVVVRYTYDAHGNVISRTDDAGDGDDSARPVPTARRRTDYAYDSRGHQVLTTFPDPGKVNHATGAIEATGSRPTVATTYDALGNAVVMRDVRGFHSYRIYDAVGRLAYEVDQTKHVTAYAYDAFGGQDVVRRHATPLATTALQNWSEGQPLTLVQMQSAGVVVAHADDRTLTSVFDDLGRQTAVVASAVTYYDAAGNAAVGSPTTAFAYDAWGDLVQESVLRSGDAADPAAVWSRTTRYHDELGRVTLAVDAEGYVTKTDFYATGEVKEVHEYARALAAPAVVGTPPAQMPLPGDAATGYDRKTSWTYDALGRKKTEASDRRYQRADGSSGRGVVGQTFGYDDEGHLTTVTENRPESPAAQTTTNHYDALGRLVSVEEPRRAVVVGSTELQLVGSTTVDLTTAFVLAERSPYTSFSYDVFGNAIEIRRHADGRSGGLVLQSPNDRVQLVRHDFQGRAVWERDAEGNVLTREFDEADHVTLVRSRLDGSDGRWAIATTMTHYDPTGRVQGHTTRRERFLGKAPEGFVTDAAEAVEYNAFGEIDVKLHAFQRDGEAFVYTYDRAGRLTSSNETGAVRHLGYDLAGNQVRASHTAWLGGGNASVDAVTSTQVDALGRAVRVTLPSHGENTATTSVFTQRFDRWGNVVQVIDTRGYQTDYEYDDGNRAVREIRPMVRVVGENGVGDWQRPVSAWYYDAMGRLVGSRDGNGHVRTNEYDAHGRLVAARDGTGALTRHVYDALGNLRMSQDALGYLTFKRYDRLGRNVALGDYLPTADGQRRVAKLRQQFALNQAGDRVAVTDALAKTAKYDYDTGSRLLRSATAAGVVTEFGYDVLGRKVVERNVGGERQQYWDGEAYVYTSEQTWKYDHFGRLIDHNNLSGRDGDYTYDAASGQQTGESFVGGVGIGANAGVESLRTYRYFANGRVREISEGVGGNTWRYEYDAAGNRTVEEATVVDSYGERIRTLTRTTYDSHNRVQRVVQDQLDFASGVLAKRVFDLTTEYDAVGNRRHVVATSGYGRYVNGVEISNTAPIVIEEVAAQHLRKGRAAQFRLLFSDIFRDLEQDALSLDIRDDNGGGPLPAWLQVSRDADTGELAFTANPPAGMADTDLKVRLTARETGNPANVAIETFDVYVRGNTGPSVVGSDPVFLRAKTGKPWGFDVVATEHFADINVGDRLGLQLHSALPAGLTADLSTTGVIRIAGTTSVQGRFYLHVRASDQDGAFVFKSFVLDIAPNSNPIAFPQTSVEAIAGRQFSWQRPLSSVFADLDNDRLSVTMTPAPGFNLPSWLTFQYLDNQAQPQLSFGGRVPADEVHGGLYVVQLTARDPDGGVATTTMTVRTYRNRAPVATPGTTTLPSMRETDMYDRTFAFADFFTDPDRDPLAIEADWALLPSLANWLKVTVDHSARTIRIWRDPQKQPVVGTFSFRLKATDIDGLDALKTLSLTVGADRKPVRTAVPVDDQPLSIGRAFSFTLPAGLFSDEDGDAITIAAYQHKNGLLSDDDVPERYRLVALPSWMQFDAATGRFYGTVPANETVRALKVRLIAKDSRGLVSGPTADVTAFGGPNYSADADIQFNLQPYVNRPPTYASGSLPNRTIKHGVAVAFDLPANAFADPDGDLLRYFGEVSINGAWKSFADIGLAVDQATGRITGTPYNPPGSSLQARIVAKDQADLSVSGEFTLTVQNTPPSLVAILPQVTSRNAMFSLAPQASDVNNDALSWWANGLPAGLSCNAATGVISGIVGAAVGAYEIQVFATDNRGGTASTTFTLTVQNSAPIPPVIPDKAAPAGQWFSFDIPAFTDPDGGTLTYEVSGRPAWMSYDPATRRLSGTPTAAGNWTIVVKATDSSGGFSSVSFRVITANDPPVYNGGLADRIAEPGQYFDYTVPVGTFSDPNNDPLTWSADANGGAWPAWLSFNSASRRFTGWPTAAGTHTIHVRVSDGGTQISRPFAITVPDRGPQANFDLPDRAGPLRESVWWQLPAGAFSDPNGDAIDYSLLVRQKVFNNQGQHVDYEWVDGSAAGLTIDSEGNISGAQLYALPGGINAGDFHYRARVVARAGSAEPAWSEFDISVLTPPVAPHIGQQVSQQHKPWTFQVPSFSPGGGALQYSATGLPAGLTLIQSGATAEIGGTPTQAGEFWVTVTASDGSSSASSSFLLYVVANVPPQPPANMPNYSGIVNQFFERDVPLFSDHDLVLRCWMTGLPPGLAYNQATDKIIGTPTAVGTYTVTYYADDDRTGISSVTFTITIGTSSAENNRPVQLEELYAPPATIDVPYGYTIPATAFSDPDDDTLYYSATGMPGWMEFNDQTRTFSGIPRRLARDMFTVTVIVSDGVLTTTATFLLEVLEGGIIPRAADEGIYTFEMGAETALPAGEPTRAQIPVHVEEYWYTYDAENRIRINGGELVGGQIELVNNRIAQSYSLSYDAAGRVAVRVVRYEGRDFFVRTVYDTRGRKVLEYHIDDHIAGNGFDGGIAKQYTYDDADRIVETRSYYENDTIVKAPVVGGEPQGVDLDISGWLSGAEVFSHDNDGRVLVHEVKGRQGGAVTWRRRAVDDSRERTDLGVLIQESKTNYTGGYDAVGRLTTYTYTSTAIHDSVHTYVSSYEGWSTWQEKAVSGAPSNSNYKATTNTLTYDAHGRLSKQVEHTPLPSSQGTLHKRARTYAYTGDGRVLSRREGTLEGSNETFTQKEDNAGARANFLFVHAAGEQQAELREGGQIRTAHGGAYPTQQIQSLGGRGNYAAGGGTVIVQEGETLQAIAHRVYGNASLWYVLADANGFFDANDTPVAGTQIVTPKVTVSSNDAGTFRPYDPSAAIGPTHPGLPYIAPPDAGCGTIGMILMVVVMVVVTVYTAGAMTAAAGSSFGTIMSTGAAALTTGTGMTAGIAATSAFAGSVVGQAAGSAMGVTSFSLRQALASGGAAAIGFWAGPALRGAAAQLGGSAFAAGAVNSVGNSLIAQATNRAAGVDTSFSWRRIAANAVAAGVTSELSPYLGRGLEAMGVDLGTANGQAAVDFANDMVGGVVGAHMRRAAGFDDRIDAGGIAVDAFANALGRRVSGQSDAVAAEVAFLQRKRSAEAAMAEIVAAGGTPSNRQRLEVSIERFAGDDDGQRRADALDWLAAELDAGRQRPPIVAADLGLPVAAYRDGAILVNEDVLKLLSSGAPGSDLVQASLMLALDEEFGHHLDAVARARAGVAGDGNLDEGALWAFSGLAGLTASAAHGAIFRTYGIGETQVTLRTNPEGLDYVAARVFTAARVAADHKSRDGGSEHFEALGHYYSTAIQSLAVGDSPLRAGTTAFYAQVGDMLAPMDATATMIRRTAAQHPLELAPAGAGFLYGWMNGEGVQDGIDLASRYLMSQMDPQEVGELRAIQMNLHNLIADGMSLEVEHRIAREVIAEGRSLNSRFGDAIAGFAIHKLGDIYAHRDYTTGLGHLVDGHTPDDFFHDDARRNSYLDDLSGLLLASNGRAADRWAVERANAPLMDLIVGTRSYVPGDTIWTGRRDQTAALTTTLQGVLRKVAAKETLPRIPGVSPLASWVGSQSTLLGVSGDHREMYTGFRDTTRADRYIWNAFSHFNHRVEYWRTRLTR